MESINQFISIVEFDYPILDVHKYNENAYGKINGILNNEMKTLYEISTSVESDNKIFPQTSFYMTDNFGDRNYYVNLCKAEIWDKMRPSNVNINEYDYFDVIENFHTGLYELEYKEYESKYMSTLAYMKFHMNLQTYINHNILDEKVFKKYITDISIKKIDFIYIDRDLLKYMKNPGKYINEIKKILKYDEKSHFYCYKGIPYVCLHEMMRYEGCSLKEIYELCGNDKLRCKYCGDEIIYNIEENEILFSKIQLGLIYAFVLSLQLDIHENYITTLILSALASSIRKLELEKDNEYENKIDGFVSLYLYKLYDKLNIKKNSTFIDFCETVWKKNNWTKEQINYALKDEKRFVEINYIENIINEFIRIESEQVDDPNTIVHVLLGNKLDEKDNPIQQLYLKSSQDLGKVAEMINKDVNNYTSLFDLKSIINATNEKFNTISNQLVLLSEKIKDSEINIKFTLEKKPQNDIIIDIKKQPSTFPKIKRIDELISDKYINETCILLKNILHTEMECNKENVLKMLNYLINNTQYNKNMLLVELSFILLPKDTMYDEFIYII